MSSQSFIPQLKNYFISVQQKDLVVNNSIVLVDTDIIFPMTSGKYYYAEVVAYVDANSSAHINTGLADIPTYRNGLWDEESPFNTALENGISRGTSTGLIKSIFRFIFIQPTQTKTMKLQFAQKNVHVSDATFHKGSFGVFWEA